MDEIKEKIDVSGKNETINDKIEEFCSGLGNLCEIMFFPVWAIVDEETNLKLVEAEIIKNLFFELEKKNKFTNDKDVCKKIFDYHQMLSIESMFKNIPSIEYPDKQDEDVTQTPPSFDNYKSKFKEMTNREFFKKFIKQMINLNKLFITMPKWKRICHAFLDFVATMSGISNLILGILSGSKLLCFLGFLIMCAWAGLICSLVFHLSLALLIPSAIILGLVTIRVSVTTVKSQMTIYKVR